MKTKRIFSHAILLITLGFAFCHCGVKGKPMPPLDPPVLGRGEPVFTEATQDIQLKKKAPPKIKDDWDDTKDFTPDFNTDDRGERSR